MNTIETLQILITNKCKNPCKFCHFSSNKKGTELQLNIINNIIKQAKELKIKKIVFNGGEPLEHSNFSNLLKIANKYGYQPFIVTNGQNFKKYLQIFNKYKPKFWFGLDGMQNKSHDYLRNKKNSFNEVINAIKKSKENGFFTAINFVVTKQNYKELPSLFEFASKYKINAIQIIKLVHDGNAYNNNDMDLNQKEEKWVKSFLLTVKYKFSSPYFNENLASTCSHLLQKHISIDWNGKINICTLSSQFNLKLPSINKMSLKNAIIKINKINKHIITQRKKEQYKNQVIDCDFCIENFKKNSEKYVYNIKCNEKINKLNKTTCNKCKYKLRNQCYFNL
jgi:MoaA/NifB/PqqE/SkfB family radical SAM enzyme